MTTVTFDKLAYVDKLKAAGFEDDKARAMAEGLDVALREQIATKTDILDARNELKLDLAEVRGTQRVNYMLGALIALNVGILARLLFVH